MGPTSRSPAATQPAYTDSLIESLIDYSEYDNLAYQSPSLSPAGSKTPFTRPIKTENGTTSLLLPSSQPLTGPSHQYDLYKQQTGIVPGALATTHALNQPHFHGFDNFGGLDLSNMGSTDDLFDFNTSPSQGGLGTPEMDLEFDSPSSSLFYGATVNPNSIGGQEPGSLPSPPPMPTLTNNMGRVYPGMHQEVALARSQQQQRQRAQAQAQAQQQVKKMPKSKTPQATDPIVEQKISQLLNSMRSQSSSGEGSQTSPIHSIPRPKKDEDEMDEDERLLASEEGKKLSSKERRQLRNKVSARAFRSRRKEYIGQLESEVAQKVNENGILRAENRALSEENKRLTDLTRMLLSSPSFSDFLGRLSSDPRMLGESQPQPQMTQSQPQQQQQQHQQHQQQQQEQRQVPKDVNPYTAQQQIGLAMIPEQNVDFSMLAMEPIDGFTYQPQVYAVLETPEPALDAAVLSGKSTSFISEQFDASADEDKVDMPVIDRPAPSPAPEQQPKEDCIPLVVNEAFENDPAFVLYHDAPAPSSSSAPAPKELDTEEVLAHCVELFAGIVPDKAQAAPRFELVDASEGEAAIARIRRISEGLEGVRERLETLTVGL